MFEPLKKLAILNLVSNVCINEDARSQSHVTALIKEVDKHCGFDKTEIVETKSEQPKALAEGRNHAHKSQSGEMQIHVYLCLALTKVLIMLK